MTVGLVKLFCTIGILGTIAGIATLTAGIVLILRSNNSFGSEDDSARYFK